MHLVQSKKRKVLLVTFLSRKVTPDRRGHQTFFIKIKGHGFYHFRDLLKFTLFFSNVRGFTPYNP